MMRFKLTVLILCIFSWASIAIAGPVNNSGVTVGDNTAGLTLVLACPNESHVSVSATAGANATVNMNISNDMVTWRLHTVLLSAASGTAVFNGVISLTFIQLTSATTGVALDYEMGCKQ